VVAGAGVVSWLDDLARARLAELEAQNLRRRLRASDDDPDLVDVSSNDYLGLRTHPALVEAACDWARRFGAGSGASRLVTGTIRPQLAVEEKLASFKHCEAALVFASGFQANASLLAMLGAELGPDTRVYADRLNHASLHHGLAAAGLRQTRFRHNDLGHLDELLARDAGKAGRALVVTESVFSMDGDRTDVAALAEIAERHGALVYLDEAHATGVLGPSGAGLAARAKGRIHVVMGTLGKALGGFGAYVAGSRALIDLVTTRCGGFIYSTAPPPAVFGALDAALDLMPGMDAERKNLARMGDDLRGHLEKLGLGHGPSSTQIIPVFVKDPLASQAFLRSRGFDAVAIRPPTVPAGTGRLRITLRADLAEHEETRLHAALTELTETQN